MENTFEEEVLNAVNYLLINGESISLNNIRKRVGHGSFSTITKILKAHNIKTARAQNFTPPDVHDPLKAKIISKLNDDINLTKIKIEELHKELNTENSAQLLEDLIFKEALVKIIAKHLPHENPLKTFCQSFYPKNLFDKDQKAMANEYLVSLHNKTIEELIASAQAISPTKFVGKEASLEALIKMLKDQKETIKKKEENAQAYYYRS